MQPAVLTDHLDEVLDIYFEAYQRARPSPTYSFEQFRLEFNVMTVLPAVYALVYGRLSTALRQVCIIHNSISSDPKIVNWMKVVHGCV